MSETHEGYLLIADITGYTRYLSESELVHAEKTLTALLELLVKNTRPPLVISRLAGDAVISYGLRENFFHGQSIIEKIEDVYVAFRKTIERLVLNNTCRCNACANISNLDLKFFIHFGTFAIQHISDHDELIGSDIILVHRLLKNSVTEKTGIRAYALFTDGALRQIGADGFADSLTPHTETYEHLGEVNVWLQDMHAVWEKKRATATVTLPADDIWERDEVDIRLPREQVWDYLIQPEFRGILIGSDRMEVTDRKEGRIAPGSVYQCYHGDKVIPQTILEWQPFESMIVRELFPMSPAVSWLSEYRLDSIDGGTRLSKTFTHPKGPFAGRLLLKLMLPLFQRWGRKAFADFARQLEADFAARGGIPAAEPAISGGQIREAAGASLRSPG